MYNINRHWDTLTNILKLLLKWFLETKSKRLFKTSKVIRSQIHLVLCACFVGISLILNDSEQPEPIGFVVIFHSVVIGTLLIFAYKHKHLCSVNPIQV